MKNQLDNLSIHIKIRKFILTDIFMDFDAKSLYPWEIWDEKAKYYRNETGYAFTPDMNDEIVEKLNPQTLTQCGAIKKVLCYYPSDLIFQHLLVREKVKKTEINTTRRGCLIDTLISIHIQEIAKLGGKVIKKI